jgi:UDP-GlcNAc:undecaprenyl-phosphate GlcNAc-1-phosphate transferase
MTFPLVVYGLAFASALVVTGLSLPLWRAWCRRTGHVDDPGHRKVHREPVALAGGLAVTTGLVVPLLGAYWSVACHLWGEHLVDALRYGFERRAAQLLAIGGGALGMLGLGWVDDRYELRPAVKFCGQLLIAVVVAASGVRVTLFVPSVVFSYAVTLLWVLTLVNAFNFVDNMNGLCAGLGGIAAAWFGVSAAGQGHYLVALLAWLVCGALVGFLPFNYPKASAFLGDAGSHLVGFLMAVLAILPHFYSTENPRRLAVLSPLLILAVPLADLAWVVVLRWRLGKPVYIGDTNHLSHRLVRRGLSPAQAVGLLWLVAATTGALAVLAL